jgi:hypothetical protein
MEYGQCKCDANFRNAKDRRNGYAPEIGLALWAAIYPNPAATLPSIRCMSIGLSHTQPCSRDTIFLPACQSKPVGKSKGQKLKHVILYYRARDPFSR